MAEHGQARHGGQQHAGPEILPLAAELLHGGLFVRVVHEVDKALEHLGIELQHILDGLAVLGVLLLS